MRSPAQAIAWEICAKNRWTLLFAFGLIPFCAVIWWIIPPGHELVNAVHVFSVIATFVSLIWVCSFTANDSRGSFSGFPSWMYTLPLRTSALVLWPMLLGLVLTLVAVGAWEFTISKCWGAPFELKYIGWHALLSVGTLFSVQAVIWSLHRFRWIRVVALVAVIFAFLYVGLVAHVFKFSHGAVFWFAGVSFTIPLAVVGAIAGVGRDRRGAWQGWTGKLLEGLLDLIPRRNGPFASAARAQLWFEWRRKGIFTTIVLGTTMGLVTFTYPLSAALYLGPIETLFNFSGPFLVMIIMAGVIGGAIAKSDAWSPDLGVHPIIATRPLTTSALAFAKMKAAALITVFGWMLFGILLWPVIAISGHMGWPSEPAQIFWRDFSTNYPRFWRWLSNPLVILALVVATWHTMMQSMAVVLTGNKRRVILSTWIGMLVLAAAAGCAVWLYKDRSKVGVVMRIFPWFMAVMMALKAFGTVRAFIAVRSLVSRRDFFVLLGLWIPVAGLVMAAGIFAHLAHGLPASLLWLLVLWQFFPANEIPGCVITLTGNRHR